MIFNTPFFLKYKYWIIAGVVLLLAVILYFVFRDTDESPKTDASGCPSSFTLDPVGGIPGISGLVRTTYSIVGEKYFKQVSGGYGGAAGQLPPQEISKNVFMRACEQYKKITPTNQ